MPVDLSASARRQCNCCTFLIGTLGCIWFAVGLGLIVYSTNLAHELAACQARFDQAQANQTSPRQTSAMPAPLSSSASTQPSVSTQNSTFNSPSVPTSNPGPTPSSASSPTSVPESSPAPASNPSPISASVPAFTSIPPSELVPGYVLSIFVATTFASIPTSTSTPPPDVLDGIYSTLLGDGQNTPLTASPLPRVTRAASPSLQLAKTTLKLGRIATATADEPAPTIAKVQGVL